MDILGCHNYVHSQVNLQNMVILSLKPPQARLANFGSQYVADERKSVETPDIVGWALAVTQAILGNKHIPRELCAQELNRHLLWTVNINIKLVDLLTDILGGDQRTGHLRSPSQALKHECWKVLRNSHQEL